MLASSDGYDIEAHDGIGEASIARDKHCGGADNFLLFAQVYGVTGGGKSACCAKPYFDKGKAIAVPHDQVDFSAAAMEILRDQRKALLKQVGAG